MIETLQAEAGGPENLLGEAGAFARFKANSWTRFVVRRLLNLVVVLIGLVILVFLILRLIPGDPAEILASISGAPDRVGIIRHELGLDVSTWQQFTNYCGDLLHGDLGNSFNTHQPVREIISQRLGNSATLAGAALATVLLVSIPGGMLAGAFTREHRHKRTEGVFTTLTSVVGSFPPYFTATLLAFVFAVRLEWLPVAGAHGFKSLILPTLAVAIPPIAVLTRVVRVETLNVLAQDYVRTARSKRLTNRRLYLRHVLPNVSTGALTIGGIVFAQLIGGAVIVENVFNRNGLGKTLVTAVLNRDYPVIQGVILALGVIIIVVNAIIDVILATIDPRTKARLA